MKEERINLIENCIREQKTISLDELCSIFEVSKNTIRRDIDVLVRRGQVRKVYGGVTYEEPQTRQLTPFEARDICFAAEKKAICQKAAAFINDGDIIYIDTGTTCIHLIDYISTKTCTIITNSLQVATKALPFPELNVIMLPGRLMRTTLSFVGSELTEHLRTYNISKAFLTCTGLTISAGLTNATTEEYQVKKAVVDNSLSHYLLADHSKFDNIALMTYAGLDKVDYLITDREPSPVYQEYFRCHQISLHLPDQPVLSE